MSFMRHWPMETEHGWIVGVSVVDTDVDPTTFTRKGAEDLANRLNADSSPGAVEALRELYEAGLDLADIIGSDDAYRRWELAMDAARPAVRGQ